LELSLKKNIIGCFVYLYGALWALPSQAQPQVELLNEPALESHLASQSVVLNMLKHDNSFIAVGERGHIIKWKNEREWQQYTVPVSVTITDVATLANGNLVAVGHDAVILLYKQESQEWIKVFDGYRLTNLLITSLESQITAQIQRLDKLPEGTDPYDEEYYLEDLQFALEDAEKEQQAGPNKPLLSVITADNGSVFATGAYGTLLQSKDNGETWKLVSRKIENVDKFHLNAIAKDANGHLFIVGENAIAARSSDDGESWQRMELPYHGSFFGIETSPNSKHLVAYGLQGHIAVSKDSGDSWRLLPKTLSISFLGGTVNEQGTAYLVGHGGLIVTFPLTAPENQSIYKHPSGSIFASIMLDEDKQVVLAGQSGIKRWTIGN
jgi:photosystem II stability/assembly factor-like uncharacterized protein